MRRAALRWVVYLSCCFAVGVAIRTYTRPDTHQQLARAGQAWADDDLATAERIAREVLGHQPQNEMARTILQAIAARQDRPLLKLALMDLSASGPPTADQLLAKGDVAQQLGLATIAHQTWQQALKLDPDHPLIQERMVTLACMQLDPERIRQLLAEQAQRHPLEERSLRLLIAADSIEDDASGMRPALELFVRTDASDVASAAALAKCLLANEDFTAVIALADQLPSSSASSFAPFRARAELALGKVEQAKQTLEQTNSADIEAIYARGLLALQEQQFTKAAEFFEKVVRARPLNKVLRARYVDSLRLAVKDADVRQQAQHLDRVRQILQNARNPEVGFDAETCIEMSEQCRSVGAEQVADVLSLHATQRDGAQR